MIPKELQSRTFPISDRWEYRSLEFDPRYSTNPYLGQAVDGGGGLDALNQLGDEGWQVIHVSDTGGMHGFTLALLQRRLRR